MRDYVIIGSTALKEHFPELDREPKDIDIVITQKCFDETIDKHSHEIEFINHNSSGYTHIVKFEHSNQVREYFIADKQESLMMLLDYPHRGHHANLGVLHSLKKSHIHYPIKFSKHIEDMHIIRSLLRKQEDTSSFDDIASVSRDLLDIYPELTQALIKDTEKRLGEVKTPKMNQSTKDFFGKSKKYVKSYYVHDDMHKAISELHTGEVIYEKILKTGSEVETDIDKWIFLSISERLYCVLEEVYVIALERKILPMMFESNAPIWTPKQAFDWALMRVCTTLCDGFFRDFAVKAYTQLQRRYDENYVNVFLKAISKYDRIEAD